MTLTIEFTPEEEARLAAQAQTQGVDIPTFLRSLVASLPLADEEASGDGRPSLDDLEALFAELADGAQNRPVLTREATTRADIYEDHD